VVRSSRFHVALAACAIALMAVATSSAPAQTALHGRALALTGGGATGTAWETGVLLGLARSGIDVNAADLVIGTSAGSIVGAEMRSGISLDDLYRAQLTADASVLAQWSKNVDTAYMAATRALYVTDHALSQSERAAVGARALAAKLPGETEWLPNFYRASGIAVLTTWPSKLLSIVAVNAADGQVDVFDKSQNVPIKLAIAASAAVPAFTPPISINGRRYTDGGVAGTNLLVARGYATVLAVIPNPASGTTADAAALQATGANVVLITPDADTKAAMGPNSLDASRKPASAEAGIRQGLAAGLELKSVWSP
jgi:NTE family protein